MTNPGGAGYRTGLAKRVWLHIYGNGGKWAPEEIAEEFGIPRQKAALVMHRMVATTGALWRYKERGRTRFGVTPSCSVPSGVSLEEVLALGLVTRPKD